MEVVMLCLKSRETGSLTPGLTTTLAPAQVPRCCLADLGANFFLKEQGLLPDSAECNREGDAVRGSTETQGTGF